MMSGNPGNTNDRKVLNEILWTPGHELQVAR
jgi:hypothetical protein